MITPTRCSASAHLLNANTSKQPHALCESSEGLCLELLGHRLRPCPWLLVAPPERSFALHYLQEPKSRRRSQNRRAQSVSNKSMCSQLGTMLRLNSTTPVSACLVRRLVLHGDDCWFCSRTLRSCWSFRAVLGSNRTLEGSVAFLQDEPVPVSRLYGHACKPNNTI